jgi:hypothetical protein
MCQKSGFLYKLGDGPINFDWNERYCILDKTKFSYYLSATDKDPRKEVDVNMATISQIKMINNHPYSFTVTVEDGTVISLS